VSWFPTRKFSSEVTTEDDGQKVWHNAEDMDVPIPLPKERPGEPLDEKRARLVYQSRKRGMLENGILLGTFASQYLDKLTEPQLDMYDQIINLPSNDWEIYYWMVDKKPTPKEFDNEVMDMLKKHAANEKYEVRNQQPPLN